MSRYTNVKVNISEGQKDKIKRAVEAQTGASIRLTHGDLLGEHVLAFTQAQVKKMAKAYQSGTGMTIKMSKTQLAHNMKVEGGFLPAILGFLGSTVAPFLLKTALPALATGALSGLASTGVSKVLGTGLYLSNGRGIVYKVRPDIKAKGLYLRPYSGSGFKQLQRERGAFVKHDGKFHYASGLITGPNSQISNVLSSIPLLGPILSAII